MGNIESPDKCDNCRGGYDPAVGDLAHNNGTLEGADPVVSSGVPGAPVEEKAAFNNFPFMNGIVERTYSAHRAGLLSQTLVSDYPNLPEDLRRGAVERAYQMALAAGQGGMVWKKR